MTKRPSHLRAVPVGSDNPAGTAGDTNAKVNEVGVPTGVPAFASVDWEDLVPRLLLLAMSRLSRMTFRGKHGQVLPGAAEAEDFVNDAIAKTLSGVRVWSKTNCSLFQHLAGIIVSDISHAATATENQLTRADDGRQPGGWPPDLPDTMPGQEEVVVWRSEQRRLLSYLAAIDPRLGEMAELILVRDVDGSVELASALGVTVADIANLRKRMKRAIRAFLIADEGDGA